MNWREKFGLCSEATRAWTRAAKWTPRRQPWVLGIALLALLSPSDLWASWQPEGTLRRAPAPLVIRVAEADGFGEPEVVATSNPHVTILSFAKAPANANAYLAKLLFDHLETGIDYYEAEPLGDGYALVLRSRRPLVRAGVTLEKKSRKSKVWDVRVELGPAPPFGGVDYSKNVTPGSPHEAALSAFEDRTHTSTDVCTPLERVSGGNSKDAAWVRLRLADCWRSHGRRNDAILSLRALATSGDVPRTVVTLAALRLEEWPESWNPHESLPWPGQEELSGLDRKTLAELLFRAARHLLLEGRPREALPMLKRVYRFRDLPQSLLASAEILRLELMYNFFEFADYAKAATVFDLAPAPAFDSPAAPGLLRIGAISFARIGAVDRARECAAPLLESRAGYGDPQLMLSLHRAFVRAKRQDEAAALEAFLPDDPVWLELLLRNGLLSPALAEELAAWTLARATAPSVALTHQLAPANALDGTRAFSEARLSTLLRALDCGGLADTAPAMAPSDLALFASLCHTASGAPVDARDVWGRARRDPGVTADVFTDTVERFSVESATFHERFSEYRQPDPVRSEP